MQGNLDNIKVGDELAVYEVKDWRTDERRWFGIEVITHVTPTQIACGVRRYKKATGRMISRYDLGRMVSALPVDIEASKADEKAKREEAAVTAQKQQAMMSDARWKMADRLCELFGSMNAQEAANRFSRSQLEAALDALGIARE